MNNPVNITVFRWAGAWGPFKVKVPCGECALTKDIIQDCIDTDLAGIPVALDMRDWLTEWWKISAQGRLARADSAGEREDSIPGRCFEPRRVDSVSHRGGCE